MINYKRLCIHSIVYAILCCIMVYNVVPIVLKHILEPAIPNSFSRNTVALNEFIVEKDGQMIGNQTNFLYIKYFDQNSDNHLLLPIYRALHLGTHITNLGYNEGGADSLQIDPADYGKEGKPENSFYRTPIEDRFKVVTDIDYKSVYTTQFNNISIMVYEYLSSHIKKINNSQDIQILSKKMTNVRFAIAFFQILSIVALFATCFIKFGYIVAWCVGSAFLLNPSFLFYTVTLYGAFTTNIWAIVYILWFYDTMKPLSSPLVHKILFCVGFSLIMGVQYYFSGQHTLFFSWLFCLGLFFYLQLLDIVQKKTIQEILPIVWRAVGVTTVLGLMSLVPMILIYLHEMKEVELLWGGHHKYISSGVKSFTIWNGYGAVESLYDRAYVYGSFVYRMLKYYHINFLAFGESMSFIKGLKLWHIICILIGSGYCFYKKNAVDFVQNYGEFCLKVLLGMFVYGSYIVLLLIISPWMMSHYRVVFPCLSMFTMVFVMFVVGQLWTINRQIKKS